MTVPMNLPATVVILGLPLLGCAAVSAQAASVERPNIIYVMLDDAGWGDFRANGNKTILTPVFDRMCREGMRFTDHYSSSAVCAPTRCALLTGLHTGHCRRRDNVATGGLEDFKGARPLVFLQSEDVTFGETLHKGGYVTGGIGKWGVGNPGSPGVPEACGFDHFFGYLDQVHAHDHYTDYLWRDGEKWLVPRVDGEPKTYVHDLFEAEALRFIEQHQKRRFLLYLPFTLPHGKFVIPDASAYADRPWPKKVKNYAAMVTRADATVGKILDLLNKLDLDENTIVFYTSDNGPNPPFVKPLGSAGPFRGTKRMLTEGGLRAPMAVRWPGQVQAGKVSSFVWTMVDVFPTLCELAGTAAPAHLDGTSVLATLKGEKQPPIPFHYWEIHHPFHQAVRAGRFKGIRYGTEEPLALYDVTADPGERADLAAEHPEMVARIEKIMAAEHTPSRYYPSRKKRQKRRRGRKK